MDFLVGFPHLVLKRDSKGLKAVYIFEKGRYKMSINLQKGQKIDLTKNNPSLKKIIVGLGWDAAEMDETNIDCDASAFLCRNGKLVKENDIVCYYNLKHKSKAVIHSGDNLTGDGEGDDEQIIVDFSKVSEDYDKIMFVVNIYECKTRKQHFGMISNAFIRIVDADTKIELCKYNLSENYDNKTAMIFGEVYRKDGEWKFNAVGQATEDTSIKSLAKRFK